MKHMRKVTFFFLLTLLALSSNAQISRYIKPVGVGDSLGTSWTNASGRTQIQTRIDEVAADPNQGTVYFAADTYLITAQIQLKNNVQLMGGYAADGSGVRDLLNNQTILDGQFNKRILFTGDNAPHIAFTKVTKVDGFVLQRGSSSYGSAVAMSVGTVLENCIIRNNNGSTFGAAVFIKRHATLANPTAGWNFGGALINCVIVNNSSSNRSAAVWVDVDSHFSLINCVIANNKSTDGIDGVGGVFVGNNIRFSRLANNIFFNNTSTVSGRNNFYSATTNFAAVWANYFSDATIPVGLGTEVTGAIPAHANLTSTNHANPLFESPTTFDGHAGSDANKRTEIENSNWRLKSTSPLIGFGASPLGRADIPYPYVSLRFNNAARAYTTVTTDIQGNTRILNTTVDMGAYEYDPISSTVSSSNNDHGTVNANQEVSKGSSITQTATPASGYRFINWTESDTEVSTATSYTFTATANRTLQANFASNTVNITEATNTNATSLNNCADCDITVTGATLTVNNTKTVKSITVEPGAKVVAGQPLTVSGEMKLKAGKATAPGVKVDAAISLTGNLTLEKTLDNTKWYFISLPSAVSIASISKVSGSGTPEYGVNWWIKYYDGESRTVNLGASSNWKTLASNATLEANKGYIIGLANSLTGDYVLSFPLSKTLISSAETARTVGVVNHGEALAITDNHKGWNLVGAPYLSSFTGSNVGANFLTFHNGTTYTQLANTAVSEIKAFSSFFVQASTEGTGANLSFALAGRQAAPALSPEISNRIQLNLTTNGGSDQTTLIVDDTQTSAYAINEDLEKWLTTGTDVPQLYTLTGEIRYAYNALPSGDLKGLALGVYTSQPVPATLALATSGEQMQSDVWLLDKQTGNEVNLNNESYSFTSQGTIENTRFEVSLQRISTASQNLMLQGSVRVDAANQTVIFSKLLPLTTIFVFDVSGKIVVSATTTDETFTTCLPQKGFYQVLLINKGQSSVTKIVL